MVEKMSACKEQVLRTPLNTFSTPKHMAMFGRPLWAMYEKCTIDIIHTFALAKIFNSNGSYDPANKDHVFAATVCRLSLDLTMSTIDSSAKIATGIGVAFANCGSNGPDHGNVCNHYSLRAYTCRLLWGDVMSSDYAGWSHILAGITGYTYI